MPVLTQGHENGHRQGESQSLRQRVCRLDDAVGHAKVFFVAEPLSDDGYYGGEAEGIAQAGEHTGKQHGGEGRRRQAQ